MSVLLSTLLVMFEENVWLLAGLLISLLILKQVKDDVRPIFISMVGPLAKNAGSNAVQWAQGILLAYLSLLGAAAEVSITMHWVWIGIFCKLSGPPVATIIALVNKSPVNSTSSVPPGSTTPPFPVAATPAGANIPPS